MSARVHGGQGGVKAQGLTRLREAYGLTAVGHGGVVGEGAVRRQMSGEAYDACGGAVYVPVRCGTVEVIPYGTSNGTEFAARRSAIQGARLHGVAAG